MKSLQDFILENVEVIESKSESKIITFNFDGLENAEEALKSFEGKEYCEIEDNKLKVTVDADNFSKLDSIKDELKKYSDTIRNSQKRSSDEQYAQKTKSFEDKVNEFTKAIDDFLNVDADPREDVKKEEKDSKDKDEE